MSLMNPNLSTARPAIERLFEPHSIALVGATERSIWSIAAVDNLKRSGYAGKIHMVNPKGGTIFGRQAYTSVVEIGEPVDAALLMVPESKMLDVFDDLKAAQVGGVVILSSGFAETGDEGAERQRQIAAKAREYGIRIIGPNCLGFANFTANTPIWTTPLRRGLPGASLAVVSQSGALASQLEQFAYQQRVGLTHMISTGNEADLNVADAIEYLAGRPEPKAIALFLESVRDPARFEQAVAAATAADKRIVVLKVGSSEATARAAQAHTGSLVGNDRVFDALCRRLGLIRVSSLEELIVTADLAGRLDRIQAPGIAFIAMSGGMCEIATDQAEADGLSLPELAPETLKTLREVLPTMATPNNPLDVTGAAMLEQELVTKAIAAIAQDPKIGLVAFTFDAPVKADERGFARSFLKHIGAGFAAAGKPCLLTSHTFSGVSADGRALADEFGIVYSGGGVRHSLKALSLLAKAGAAARPAASTAAAPAKRPVSEREVLEHLAAQGVPVIPAHIVRSADEAAAAARGETDPVVLKIASPDIQHKTEVGGVVLNLRGEAEVRAAYERIVASVKAAKPEARIDGVIVSPMRGKGTELFVGTLRDPQWGPAIAVGLGGIFVEALKDTSLRLLPITEQDALEMLGELRGRALLDGFRGTPAVDRQAAARAIVAIGNAALALGPELLSLEVNPLLARGAAVEALDGVAEWSADHVQA